MTRTRTSNDWYKSARSDAKNTVENFMDEIVSNLMDEGKASNNLFNDYEGADYHNNYNIPGNIDLLESAKILNQLSDHEEADSGLWESLPPREAVEAQAHYTYQNAVMYLWQNLISEINDGCEELIEGWVLIKDNQEGEEDREVFQQKFTYAIKAIIEEW
jgi:hypothetical protein